MSERAKVSFIKEEDLLIAELIGEINILDVNDFKDIIKEKIDEEDVEKVIVDLEKVPFMDSSGLGMLISLYKFVSEKDGKIIYTGLSDYIIKILGFAKLDKIFTIYDSLDEAKGALK